MRHRAPRPIASLPRRIPRAAARLVADAANLRVGRALVALVMLLSIGTAAYAAVESVTGGSPDQQAESAGSSLAGDDPTESPDGEQTGSTGGLATSDRPSPSASTSEPSRSGNDRRAGRKQTVSPTPEDDSAPNTSLSASYPAGDSATFTFSADESASFTCSLDGAAFTSCGSGVHYSDLAPGWHTFAVRATDSAGNTDPSPAETRWHAKDGRAPAQ